MHRTLTALAIVAAASCGKKSQESSEQAPPAPAPAPASAADAGLRPPGPDKPVDLLDKATFVVQLSYASGERSKDSSSDVVHVSIFGARLFYKEIPQGAGADRRHPIELPGADLDAAEVAALKKLLADDGLLSSPGMKAPAVASGPHHFVRADLKVRVDDVRNQLTVSGVTSQAGTATELAKSEAYRGVEALVAALRKLAVAHQPAAPAK